MPNRLVCLDAGFGDVNVESEAAARFGATVEDASDRLWDEAVEASATADGALVRYSRVDAATIGRCPGWRVIGRYGVGVDNIDLGAASARGIAVVNVPDYCIEEVATHTAALILASWRRLFPARRLIGEGAWDNWQPLRPVHPLSGATLGLVGAGRIGSEVVRLMSPFFGRVIVYDPVRQSPVPSEAVTLDEVFSHADVVSLHCPLTAETTRLVNAARLESMKPGALLVNVSRGGLVDTAALADGLHRGRPGGAALDVLPREPPAADDPLLGAPNLVLTNHVAWYSEEALVRLRQLVGERCAAYLAGQPVPTIVNLKELKGRMTP
jgi:D-3-phosphoglycerate dehydrogenase / 2-oxoglutarate reductase